MNKFGMDYMDGLLSLYAICDRIMATGRWSCEHNLIVVNVLKLHNKCYCFVSFVHFLKIYFVDVCTYTVRKILIWNAIKLFTSSE